MASVDLTTRSIPAALTRLALPILFGMIMFTLYLLADLYFVGRLGPDAVAAAPGTRKPPGGGLGEARRHPGEPFEHGSDPKDHQPAKEPTDRKKLLLDWFARNKKPG